jgi:hypothetical protein
MAEVWTCVGLDAIVGGLGMGCLLRMVVVGVRIRAGNAIGLAECGEKGDWLGRRQILFPLCLSLQLAPMSRGSTSDVYVG